MWLTTSSSESCSSFISLLNSVLNNSRSRKTFHRNYYKSMNDWTLNKEKLKNKSKDSRKSCASEKSKGSTLPGTQPLLLHTSWGKPGRGITWKASWWTRAWSKRSLERHWATKKIQRRATALRELIPRIVCWEAMKRFYRSSSSWSRI